jgi:hypothetical protein
MNKLFSVFDQVSAKIFNMTDRQDIINYLDMLEADIIETPYGDMVYEHAFELAQVRFQQLDNIKTPTQSDRLPADWTI